MYNRVLATPLPRCTLILNFLNVIISYLPKIELNVIQEEYSFQVFEIIYII